MPRIIVTRVQEWEEAVAGFLPEGENFDEFAQTLVEGSEPDTESLTWELRD